MFDSCHQVAWGSIGADGHEVSAIVRWSGDDEYSGLFSSIAKTFKRVVKDVKRNPLNVVKYTPAGLQVRSAVKYKKTAKDITGTAKVIRPYVRVGAIGVSAVFPPAAPIAAGVASAVEITAAADQYVKMIPNRQAKRAKRVIRDVKSGNRAAKKAVLGSYHRAVRGDIKAQRAITTLASVHREQKRQKALKLVANTRRMADAGDPNAKRAISYIRVVRTARKRAQEQGRTVAFTVDKHGFVHRVM